MSLILVALIIGVIQVVSNRLINARLAAIHDDVATARAHAVAAAADIRDVEVVANQAAENSRQALALLSPAIAQLPRTRSKRAPKGQS